jgi:hypothetical protein
MEVLSLRTVCWLSDLIGVAFLLLLFGGIVANGKG